MTGKNLVYLEVESNIATLTIDNPPLNVLTDVLLDELNTRINELLSNQDLRVLIIRGAGEKAFVAGADIQQFPSLTKDTGKQLVEKGKAVLDKLASAPFIVICAINGFALGGGLEIALACDIRIAEEKAKLGLPEVGLGVLPGYGGTQRLGRLVGIGKTLELVSSGEHISAHEAYRIGLVERFVADGESYNNAKELAQVIATNAPIAVSKAKEIIYKGFNGSLEAGQSLETEAFGELCTTNDMQEGVKAFMEKRKAEFKHS